MYELVRVRVGSRYELVKVRVGIRYELACRYELAYGTTWLGYELTGNLPRHWIPSRAELTIIGTITSFRWTLIHLCIDRQWSAKRSSRRPNLPRLLLLLMMMMNMYTYLIKSSSFFSLLFPIPVSLLYNQIIYLDCARIYLTYSWKYQ